MSNLENTWILSVSILEGDSCLVDYALLKRYLATLKKGELIKIKNNKDDTVSIINHEGKNVGTLASEDVNDFPETPNLHEQGNNLYWIGDDFDFSMYKKYASKDEMRKAMTGINVNATQIACTDARNLVTTNKLSNTEGIILPISVSTIKKGKLFANKTHSIIVEGKHILISRLIDGVYPEYQNVIPQTAEYKAIFDRVILIDELKKALAFTSNLKNAILEINQNNCIVSTEDLDFNRSYRNDMYCNSDCDNFKIKVHIESLIMILNDCKNDTVTLELQTPNRAIVIKDNDNLFLSMPVLID